MSVGANTSGNLRYLLPRNEHVNLILNCGNTRTLEPALWLESLEDCTPRLCDLAVGFCPRFLFCNNANKVFKTIRWEPSLRGVTGRCWCRIKLGINSDDRGDTSLAWRVRKSVGFDDQWAGVSSGRWWVWHVCCLPRVACRVVYILKRYLYDIIGYIYLKDMVANWHLLNTQKCQTFGEQVDGWSVKSQERGNKGKVKANGPTQQHNLLVMTQKVVLIRRLHTAEDWATPHTHTTEEAQWVPWVFPKRKACVGKINPVVFKGKIFDTNSL